MSNENDFFPELCIQGKDENEDWEESATKSIRHSTVFAPSFLVGVSLKGMRKSNLEKDILINNLQVSVTSLIKRVEQLEKEVDMLKTIISQGDFVSIDKGDFET